VADRVTVDLAELDQVLARRSPYRGLAETVAAVTERPLRDRRAERSAAMAAREAPLVLARELLAAQPAFAGLPWGEAWLAEMRRSGLLARADDAARAVQNAVIVLAEVLAPSVAARSRSELSARVTGSAHGLDDGTVVSQLTLRALALDAEIEPPVTAAARRDLWERYAVSVDSVSSTCLTLGLLGRGGSVAGRLRLAAEAGDPTHITPRDLRHLEFAPHRHVLVCENPRVLEAMADRFGGDLPTVCTAGQPALVVLDVLRRLAMINSTLHYHGDFDWPGIAIANRLVAQAGVAPWQMGAPNYQAAVMRGPSALELSGAPVVTTWDPMLSAVMIRLGVVVHEEAILDDLLAAAAQLTR